MERLQQQMKFILEVDKVKQIIRQTYLAEGAVRKMMRNIPGIWLLLAVLLKEYANEEVDLAKVIPMVLLHDLVEIDAGDTYAYDQAGLATQRARETKAADRIFGMLPEDQGTSSEIYGKNLKHMRQQRRICTCAGQLSATASE